MCMEGLNARVAQSVERSAVNRKVGGSNPPVSDIFIILNIMSEHNINDVCAPPTPWSFRPDALSIYSH